MILEFYMLRAIDWFALSNDRSFTSPSIDEITHRPT